MSVCVYIYVICIYMLYMCVYMLYVYICYIQLNIILANKTSHPISFSLFKL